MKITLIGSGNVATQLGTAFKKSGHEIVGVVSRNPLTGASLAKKLGSGFSQLLNKQMAACDVILIAVKDSEIKNIIQLLPATKAVLAHTSGSIGIDVFSAHAKKHGVFYPLQTLKKHKQNFKKVPICLEANKNASEQVLFNLAKSISDNIFFLTSEQRLKTHLAAVFANNFTNHMYAIAEQLLLKNDLPFELLKPLIAQTAANAIESSPAANQTGPAIRNDKVTIDKHLQLLKNNKDLKDLYQLITASIFKSAGK
jgi:predicted short-subunit dehydrogenase-like oxidoreductase (DUF2520 family)